MTDHKTPVDHAIDLLVYAPLGFALDARALLPKLIDRGRDQVSNQVTIARMMGQFAVQQGQNEATKHLAKVQEQATVALADLGLLPRSNDEELAVEVEVETTLAAVPDEPPAPARSTRAAKAAPRPATLSIPDYDSLAASQVIPRLEGLTAAELEAVRTYEAANRGRKTILNKVAQLQG